ncbi:MAG: FecR family protein [Candidatus Acidiferrales bacterium]
MRRCSGFGLFLLLLICVALALTSVSRPARASDLSYARIVRVSLVSGDVQLSRPGHPAWEAAAQNMPVTQGVAIGTNNGYAEIEFEDGTTAWISRDTLVQFTELALADGGRITKLTLAQGTMSILTSMRRGDTFTLSTSGETMAVPKNAFFRVDCFHDGASVSVIGGAVDVTSAAGTKVVPKGKTLAYQAKLTNVALSANPKPDEWDRWTVGRARSTQAETAQSASYVDAPFSYGLADMSAYGAWNYFAGYGYGWQPYGMGNCWMPFMNGAWDFYPQFGWTWVSAEPWGWTPYHFGSWSYLPSGGWAWFPSDFASWDPAPVDWYSAGNQVGWWPAAFSGGSPLMFEQIMSGCSGFGGGYGAFGNSRFARLAIRPTRKPPSRLMLTTSRLGHSDGVSLFAYAEADGQKMPIRSSEPLENGKASGMAMLALAGNPRTAPRMLVPTAPDLAHLQHSLAFAGARVSAMKLNPAMPSAPPRESFRAVNAMSAAPMPSHRPSPMSQASYSDSIRGYSPQGSMGGTSNYSAAAARAPSGSSSSAAHASTASGGRPH